MNDQPLSQNMGDYSAEEQAAMQKIFEEEKAKTVAYLRGEVEAPAILVGGVGQGGGIFNALSTDGSQ